MAEQVKLVLRDESTDFYGGSGDVSNLDLSTWLAEQGWQQAVAADESTVDEALTLHVPGTTDDNLAANVQALDAMLLNAQRVNDFQNFREVWLRAQMAGESGARQALVTAVKRSPNVQQTDPLAVQHYLRDYFLGLKRAALWEGTTLRTTTGTGISALGGKLNYSGLAGDRAARVALTRLASSSNLNEFWLGVQSTRLNATPANLNPIWNLRLTAVANYGSDTTGGTSNADATAQDGYKVVCTFATASSLAMRCIITTNEVSNQQYGRYMVLLRAKTTSTRTARVRLGMGNWYSGAGFFNTLNRVLISGNSWKLYQLGEVYLPVRPNMNTVTGFRSAGFRVEAESVSGSGNLELDCLVLIPSLDGVLHVSGTNPVSASWIYEVYHRPGGELYGKVLDSALTGIQIEELHPDGQTWGLEPANGTLVCAGQYNGVSTKADTLDVTMSAYERWVTLRGAE